MKINVREKLEHAKAHLRQFNWLTFFAIVCIAVTSGVIIFSKFKLIEILSAPDWCVRAINAEKLSNVRSESAFDNCGELLLVQVKSLATTLHIDSITQAAALLVLVVVVLAKAKLDLEVSKTGAKTKIGYDHGPQSPEEAAEETAQAAVDKAEQIAEATPPAKDAGLPESLR